MQREGDYEGASRLLYGEIPSLEAELDAAQQAETATAFDDLMVNERVGARRHRRGRGARGPASPSTA